jgi:hypothetical protein
MKIVLYDDYNETFGPKAIKQILRSTGWTEDDPRRLGLLPAPFSASATEISLTHDMRYSPYVRCRRCLNTSINPLGDGLCRGCQALFSSGYSKH